MNVKFEWNETMLSSEIVLTSENKTEREVIEKLWRERNRLKIIQFRDEGDRITASISFIRT